MKAQVRWCIAFVSKYSTVAMDYRGMQKWSGQRNIGGGSCTGMTTQLIHGYRKEQDVLMVFYNSTFHYWCTALQARTMATEDGLSNAASMFHWSAQQKVQFRIDWTRDPTVVAVTAIPSRCGAKVWFACARWCMQKKSEAKSAPWVPPFVCSTKVLLRPVLK